MLGASLFHIAETDTHNRNIEKHQRQKQERGPRKGQLQQGVILKRRGEISLRLCSPVLLFSSKGHRVCCCASVSECVCVMSSVCAVVLQLGDDGDQVLETKDVAAVQALVRHSVLLVMSAGGVGKIYHLHIHLGAAGV